MTREPSGAICGFGALLLAAMMGFGASFAGSGLATGLGAGVVSVFAVTAWDFSSFVGAVCTFGALLTAAMTGFGASFAGSGFASGLGAGVVSAFAVTA